MGTLLAATLQAFKRVDILVAAAADAPDPVDIMQTAEADFDAMLRTGLKSVFLVGASSTLCGPWTEESCGTVWKLVLARAISLCSGAALDQSVVNTSI